MNQEILSLIQSLNKEKQEIDNKINQLLQSYYKVEKEEMMRVTSINPYSRLMALQKMNIIQNYQEIQNKCIIVVGVGGVGSVYSEMMVRCGIGKIILIDYDKLELSNMNRLFYQPDQIGQFKVDAAKSTLKNINPNVNIESKCLNINQNEDYKVFQQLFEDNRIDLVISCVDNYAARITINSTCNWLDLPWIESGVSENAQSCHIQFILPGETSCFMCIPPVAVSDDTENQIQREGVCAASLPTTMAIAAALLAQTTLKYLLQYGQINFYQQFNALNDFFFNQKMPPNDSCLDNNCWGLQDTKKSNKIRLNKIEQQNENYDNNKMKAQEHDQTLDQYDIEIIEDSEIPQAQSRVSDQKTLSLDQLQNKLKNLFSK